MLKVVVFNAVTFNDNRFIVGIKRVPESENDNGSIFGNIINRGLLISRVFFNFRSADITIIWLKSP